MYLPEVYTSHKNHNIVYQNHLTTTTVYVNMDFLQDYSVIARGPPATTNRSRLSIFISFTICMYVNVRRRPILPQHTQTQNIDCLFKLPTTLVNRYTTANHQIIIMRGLTVVRNNTQRHDKKITLTNQRTKYAKSIILSSG